jgi:hypothetical protein
MATQDSATQGQQGTNTERANPVKGGGNPPQSPNQSQTNQDPRARPPLMHYVHNTYWIGSYLIAACVVLTMFIYMLWPRVIGTAEEEAVSVDSVVMTVTINGTDTTVTRSGPAISAGDEKAAGRSKDQDELKLCKGTWIFFGKVLPIGEESRYILLVLLLGALGSYLHAVTSFVTFAGNRKLVVSWLWWYILRPFIGGPLALIFYFVIRGGFLSTGADATNISIYGIAGTSALVGMFSKNAIDKLEEVFTTLFRSKEGKGDAARADKAVDQAMVEEKMIPAHKITTFTIKENTTLAQITLNEIYPLFQGIVTRIPVVSHENKLKYIIHQSILYQYIANQSVALAGQNQQFQLANITLDQFVNDPEVNKYVEQSIVMVSRKAALIEAKRIMEATNNCQDVFVTENGIKDEPLIGWLTNIDISKNLAETT